MKKIILIITVVAALFSMSIAVSAEEYAVEIGTAEYATVIPVIDGEVDSIWYDTYGYITTGTHYTLAQGAIKDVARAEIRVLWTEHALYFLARVHDSTLPTDRDCTSNCVNFWVSENNTQDIDAHYNQEAGDWFLCVNHYGTILQYDSNGEKPAIPDEYAVQITADGYVVEFKMSIQSDDLMYSVGHIIGFNVSCDDEFGGDPTRDHYNNLYDEGAYWSNPGQMPHLRLEKAGCICEVRCEGEGNESCPLCSVNIADCGVLESEQPDETEPAEPEAKPTNPTEPNETESTEPPDEPELQETGIFAWIKNLIAAIIAFFANLFG